MSARKFGVGLAIGLLSLGAQAAPALKYFGYALVDCRYDDPLDATAKKNYTTEVAAFSNIAHMCIFNPGENIAGRLNLMARNQMKAFLAVQELFFEAKPDATTGSGVRFILRANYVARWEAFIAANSNADFSNVRSFYIADEPVWNGISFGDLKKVSDLIKHDFPATPVSLIEASPAIASLRVPESVDWIGFDRYGVPNPDTNPGYLANLRLLKSKRTRSDQKILIVMDAQWLPYYRYPATAMAVVATRYYKLAKSDVDVVAMLGYLWPGGFDDVQQLGTRELPPNVLMEHQRIGKIISGK